MNKIKTLVNRHLKNFMRDKATVFFSFLSVLILIGLYFLFIAQIYTSQMDNPDAGGIGTAIADNAKAYMVYLQMMAGVMILNSVSLATGCFSTIAKDFESRRVESILLTRVKPHELILSYFLTGLIVTFVLNIFMWCLSFIIIGAATGFWVSFGTFSMVLIVLLVASLVSCSFMLLLTTVIKSSTAVGVLSGILGTFLGFICGIYMPYSNMGEGVKAVGSLLPFTHLVVWLKQIVLGDAFSQVGITGEFKDIIANDFFSAGNIGFATLPVPLGIMLLLSGLVAVICLIVSYFLLTRRIKSARP